MTTRVVTHRLLVSDRSLVRLLHLARTTHVPEIHWNSSYPSHEVHFRGTIRASVPDSVIPIGHEVDVQALYQAIHGDGARGCRV